MASVRHTLRQIFVWNYDRGTLQYDIICALILAFIFFVPRSCFVSGQNEGSTSSIQKTYAAPNPDNSGNEHKQK